MDGKRQSRTGAGTVAASGGSLAASTASTRGASASTRHATGATTGNASGTSTVGASVASIKPTISLVSRALEWHGIRDIAGEAIRRAKKNDNDAHVVYCTYFVATTAWWLVWQSLILIDAHM